MNQTLRAIILDRSPLADRDVLVTALTMEQGKILLLAKNARSSRRFGTSLEIGSEGTIEATRPAKNPTRWIAVEAHLRFRPVLKEYQQAEALRAVGIFFQRILPSETPVPEYYNLLAWFIRSPIGRETMPRLVQDLARLSGEAPGMIHGVPTPRDWFHHAN